MIKKNRRIRFHILIGIALLLNSAARAEPGAEKTATPPNIVLLLSDDQAWTDYGFMGHPDIETPHLDRLAEESLLFRRGYLAAPVCRPSLASMVTGLHPFDHGVTGNDVEENVRGDEREPIDKRLREIFYRHPNFIQMLTNHGYLAHQSGKWWEGSYRDGGFTHGMKESGRHGSRASLAIGREGNEAVKSFIDMALDEQKPFFVWYGVFLPHTPHNPPARLLKKYKKEGRAKDVAKYYAMCEWLDEACGDLLDYLDEKGIRENTVVIYICDNGWAATSTNDGIAPQRGWRRYAQRSKASPYENGIRTPVMIRWPGTVEPEDNPNLAHSLDLFPTFADLAGFEPPDGLPGINLLNDSALEAREAIFGSVHSTHNIAPADPEQTLQYLWCIEGDWKLIERYHGIDTTSYRVLHSWDTEPVRLYNLEEDPHEKNNLADQHPEIVARMKALIEDWYLLLRQATAASNEPQG